MYNQIVGIYRCMKTVKQRGGYHEAWTHVSLPNLCFKQLHIYSAHLFFFKVICKSLLLLGVGDMYNYGNAIYREWILIIKEILIKKPHPRCHNVIFACLLCSVFLSFYLNGCYVNLLSKLSLIFKEWRVIVLFVL